MPGLRLVSLLLRMSEPAAIPSAQFYNDSSVIILPTVCFDTERRASEMPPTAEC